MNKIISTVLVSAALMAGITACTDDGDKCDPDKSACTQDDGGHYIPIMMPGYAPGYYPRLGGSGSNSYGPRAITPPRAYSPPAEEEEPGTGGRSFGGGGRGGFSGGRGGR